MDLNIIQKSFAPFADPERSTITQLKHEEDNEPYQVWRIDTENGSFILKEAKEFEAEAYQTILTEQKEILLPYIKQPLLMTKPICSWSM